LAKHDAIPEHARVKHMIILEVGGGFVHHSRLLLIFKIINFKWYW